VHYFDAHGPWNSAPAEIRARFVDPSYKGPVDGEKPGTEALIQAVRDGTARPEDVREGEALYHAEVASEDASFGALLDGLGTRKLLANTALVLFGDHGEAVRRGTPSARSATASTSTCSRSMCRS